MFKIKPFFALFYVLLIQSLAVEYIPCPLVWIETSLGEPTPADIIATASYGEDNFVARIKDKNLNYRGGRVEEGIAYFVYNDGIENVTTYELLTNPSKCVVEWIRNQGDPFLVPVDTLKTELIGRAVFNKRLQSGHVSSGVLSVVTDELNVGDTSNFEVLRSFSQGLTLSVTSFKFDESPFEGNPDFLGIDQLYNRADTVIRQTVKHSKEVYESTEITTTSGWGHVFSVSLSIDAQIEAAITPPWGENSTDVPFELPLPPLEFEFPLNYPEEKRKSQRTEFQRKIEAEREIVVLPYTSVMVCSTVTIQENSMIPYVAIGKYSGAGMSAADVQKLLSKDGLTATRVQGNDVYVELKGTFSATSAMANRFYITPFGDGPNCSEFSKKIKELKWAKATKSLDSKSVKERQLEIKDYMQKMGINNQPNVNN